MSNINWITWYACNNNSILFFKCKLALKDSSPFTLLFCFFFVTQLILEAKSNKFNTYIKHDQLNNSIETICVDYIFDYFHQGKNARLSILAQPTKTSDA